MDDSTNNSLKEVKQPYSGWLTSHSFLKRAFAIWIHYFVASIIIAVVFGIIVMAFGFSLVALFHGMH